MTTRTTKKTGTGTESHRDGKANTLNLRLCESCVSETEARANPMSTIGLCGRCGFADSKLFLVTSLPNPAELVARDLMGVALALAALPEPGPDALPTAKAMARQALELTRRASRG